MKKTNWIRHSLDSHLYILESLGTEYACTCPILTVDFIDGRRQTTKDTYPEGVYYRRGDVTYYVKSESKWYYYDGVESFKAKHFNLIVKEMTAFERNAIDSISRTKYATEEQKKIATELRWIAYARTEKKINFRSWHIINKVFINRELSVLKNI